MVFAFKKHKISILNRKIISFLVFIIITISTTFSQEKISCKIVDTSSGAPIVYATVMLKNINRGTHADLNGNFEIPIAQKNKGIIRISSIGYKTKEVKLSQLKTNSVNVIYLSIANNQLNEIVIKTSKKKKRQLLGIQIIKQAIQNITENYPTEPHSYIGYYRDYQQPVGNSYQKNIQSKEEIKYLNVHEAIIESFDDGFDSNKLESKKNQSLLYNYRINNQFIQDPSLTVPYDNEKRKYSESVYITPLGGNELNLLNLTNTIRNHDKMSFSFSNVFEKDFVKNHKFKVKQIIFSDTTPIYEVSFTSIMETTNYDYAAFGTIYISKQDFAIHKLNYNLYYNNKKNPQYSVTIEYIPKKDKMYLNYITFNNFFEAYSGEYFKLIKTYYNPKQQSFEMHFNRLVALNSIHKRNFKIYYKNKRLKVLDIIPIEGSTRIFNVVIDEKSFNEVILKKENVNLIYSPYLKLDITNIKDLNGFEINKRPSLKINQYREFFVQETFEQKELPIQQNFIDKNSPLSKSLITPLELENNYWINTPLKSSKN